MTESKDVRVRNTTDVILVGIGGYGDVYLSLILEGDLVEARKWHKKLFALSKNLLTLSTNPIPIKAAMAILDMCSAEMRLPMTPLDQDKLAVLQQTLKDYGLLD